MHQEKNYDKYLLHIGERIAAERLLSGKDADTVAKAVNISAATLNEIEHGQHRTVKYTTIIDLYLYFHISLIEVFPSGA